MISFYLSSNLKEAIIFEYDRFYFFNVQDHYGKEFLFQSVTPTANDHCFDLILSQNPEAIECPFCGKSHFKVHKKETRTVNDFFYLLCEKVGPNVTARPWRIGGSLLLNLTFDNFTYRCNNENCGRLFKVLPTFLPSEYKYFYSLSEKPKSHYTTRMTYIDSHAGESTWLSKLRSSAPASTKYAMRKIYKIDRQQTGWEICRQPYVLMPFEKKYNH